MFDHNYFDGFPTSLLFIELDTFLSLTNICSPSNSRNFVKKKTFSLHFTLYTLIVKCFDCEYFYNFYTRNVTLVLHCCFYMPCHHWHITWYLTSSLKEFRSSTSWAPNNTDQSVNIRDSAGEHVRRGSSISLCHILCCHFIFNRRCNNMDRMF
jgi:hypothetical protein